VIGDAVNVASRLEGANKSYGTQILIGEATERLARGAIGTREIDSIAVYGREEGVAVHELIGLADQVELAEALGWIAGYERGLAKYRVRDFEGAIADFDAVLGARPGDRPASIIRERCLHLLHVGSDPTWRPVVALNTK